MITTTQDAAEETAAAAAARVEVAVPSAWRTIALAFIGLELIVLYAPTFRFLWSRWTASVWQNAHGMFVPPLVGYLAWHELRQRPELRHESGSALGFVLLVPALLVNALDAGMHTELLSAMTLVAALPGLSLLYLGLERTRRMAFPLAFMVFALPIPLGMTETAHLILRKLTVTATSTMLPLFGLSVYAEGTTLQMARGALEVADACSGFSTLYAALAVATLTAYMSSTAWRRALVLIAAAPIAVASNVLRVLLLCVLVQWQGEGVLETFLHPLSGLLTFAVSLPLIFWLGGAL